MLLSTAGRLGDEPQYVPIQHSFPITVKLAELQPKRKLIGRLSSDEDYMAVYLHNDATMTLPARRDA